jgi:GNAT superfamily N-acetyltransferase
MAIRRLTRGEVDLIWTIDRSEVHHRIYRAVGGQLTLVPAYFEIPGWPPGMIESDTPRLYECFDRGGVFLGDFAGSALAGVAVVDTRAIPSKPDHLQLLFLYVSRSARGKGVGTTLFAAAADAARELGAEALYISAAPTENTVNFYLRRGSSPAVVPDPDLFAAEPDDIHLTYPL